MDRRGSSSFLSTALRELDGSRVRKRNILGGLTMSESGSLRIEHEGTSCPPLAVSFCKSSRCSHLLATSDEEGYVSLCDTRNKIGSGNSSAGDYRIRDWVAHENAIFDVCWMKEGTLILTASGDQTLKIWDVESKRCIGTMVGHKGSVKAVCCHHSNQDLLVSGSRDGSFALWDLRCKPDSVNSHREANYRSTYMVRDTQHRSLPQKRVRRGKVISMSITSVLYLNDDISIASATDSDSVVKFWDSRCLKSFVTQASPSPKSSIKGEVSHGVSSLSQDERGTFLAASCMDNMIYLYDMFHLENGPIKSYSGSVIGSFYVKAAISPDATQILSGSSDKNAYLWQVDRPDICPARLNGHNGEVTSVDWCFSEFGKVATSSDDYTIRVWDVKYDHHSCASSPKTNRKRIRVAPESNFKDVMDMPSASPQKNRDLGVGKRSSSASPTSPIRELLFQPSTPESAKKLVNSCPQQLKACRVQKTPEPLDSPSSVLNPPPSLKRTIRDYFASS